MNKPVALTKAIQKFWSRIDKQGDHWLWIGKSRRGPLGYGSLHTPVALGLGRKSVYAHRFVFFLTHGYWPMNARHTCDIPLCCRPDHIIEGTQADNVKDCVLRNRARNGNLKLNPEIWNAIRQSKESSRVLSEKYNVTAGHIRRIRQGVTGNEYRP